MPIDAAVEIRFDRYLMPASAVRQSVLIYSGTPDNALFLDPRYDLIERVLTFRPADALLEPRLLYTVELAVYDEASGFGFRAYDGAPLAEEGSAPLTFTFRTSDAPQGASAGAERRIGCDEGLRGFAENCGSASCHGSGPRAAMGLMLDSVTALQRTAINRVAHQTEVGASAGVSLVDPPRFGVQMPVIEPGSAANSYLAYKLLRNPENFRGPERCQSAYRVALPAGDCLAPDARERERLREWFVRLDPMPPVGGVVGSLEGLRLIVGFIDQGADVGGCE